MEISVNFSTSGLMVVMSGNPVVLTVNTSNDGVSADATLKRVVLEVRVDGKVTRFVRPYVGGESFPVDVKSAFRRAYDAVDMGADDKGGVMKVGTVSGYVLYVRDGVEHKNDAVVNGALVACGLRTASAGRGIYALRGGVPESVVVRNGWRLHDEAVAAYRNRLSLKPDGGELVNGGVMVWKIADDKVAAAGAGSGVMDDDDRRVEMRFVNSFGVVENCWPLVVDEKYEEGGDEYSVVGEASFMPNSAWAVKGNGGRGSLAMSSGPMTREWLRWWASEFLPQRRRGRDNRYWLKVAGGRWMEVTVSANEATVRNGKGEMKSVEFVVKSAVEGELVV